MNVARTLDADRRSPRAVRALLRAQQRDENEHLKALALTGRATQGQLAHLAQRIGLRGCRVAVLDRHVRNQESDHAA